MRSQIKYLVYILLVIGVAGCGPEVSDEELGRVVFEVPEIPAGHKPYELPDLTASPESPSRPDEPSEPSGPAAEETLQPDDGIEPAGPPSDTVPPDAITPAAD